MKRILPILTALLLTVLTACDNSDSIYSNLLQKEKNLINAYVKRNGINILKETPETWGANDYLELDDYLYYHPVQQGDTASEAVTSGDIVLIRYRKYTLNEEADTLSYWTTNDSAEPVEFTYGSTVSNSSVMCSGWLMAIQKMKYSNAECKLICPSKMGMKADGTSVTPYGYDLKIVIKKY